jgi:PAS domain S-box-containing protein
MDALDVGAIVLSGHDVTDYTRADEALEAYAATLAERVRLLDLVHDAILVRHQDGAIQYWSRGAEEMYGWRSDEAIGRNSIELLQPELPSPLAVIEAELAHAGRWQGEVTHIARDGRQLMVASRWALQLDERGHPKAILEINRDVTARHRAELALREAEARFRALVQHSSDLTMVIAREGVRSYVSPSVTRLLGYQPGDLAETSFYNLVHPDDESTARAHIAAVIADPATNQTMELRYRHRDGTYRWLEVVSANLLAESSVAGIVINARDVTERRRVEEERAALLVAEQEYGRRLRELGALRSDLTAMVAHELGSPIAAIRVWSELMAGGLVKPDETPRALAGILEQTAHLDRLVMDVAKVAAAEREDFAVKPRPIAIDTLLTDAAVYARTLRGDHPCTVAAPPAIQVLVDPDRIGQVLRNLLNNAAKHTPPGTPITLRATPNGASLRIEVADQGPGIHPGDLVRIFEKFGRGRDAAGQKTPGVGLGLYLSRRIVQAHGSELTVNSIVGEGTVFGFSVAIAG